MVMEPPRRYASAGIRVDTAAGKLYVAFPATGGGDEEIAVDVSPSQLARLAEGCGGDHGGAAAPGEPEMGEEELEALKDEIMKRTRDRRPFYPSKICADLGLELGVVMRAIKSLESEGKLRETEHG